MHERDTVHEPSLAARAAPHARARRRRGGVLWVCVLAGYALGIAGYGIWTYARARADMLARIDEFLLQGARAAKYLLAEDFHDRAIAKDRVAVEEDLRNIRVLNRFVADAGLKYIYTLIERDGVLYFTSSSHTEEDLRTNPCWCFTRYAEADPRFLMALRASAPSCLTCSDRWGEFRSALVPETSPTGVRYLAGADYSLGYVDAVLAETTVRAVAVELLVILAFSAPLLFLFRHGTRSSIADLRQEIGERAKAEAALREALGTSSAIVDGIPSGLFIYRYEPPDRLILEDHNAAADRLTGISMQRFHGTEFNEIWPNATAQGLTAAFLSVARTREPCHIEDGTYRDDRLDGAFTIFVFPMPDGRIGVAFENTTEKKTAEKALQRLEFSLQHVGEALFWLDRDGCFIDVNEHACRLLGRTRGEFLQMHFADIAPAFPRSAWAAFWHEIETSKSFVREATHCRADGTEIPVELSVNQFKFEGKDYACVFARDASERKRSEAERNKLEQRLAQAQKMEAIGTLAGGIAHDFNNILYPIIGFTEMVIDDLPEDCLQRKNLDEVLRAAQRASDLVRQILAFSRQREQDRKPLKVQPIIREALVLLRASLPSTIEICQDIDPACGAIMADPTQVHQIIMNLCTNAFHAMREQGGVLHISLADVQVAANDTSVDLALAPGAYVRLGIGDTGQGMTRETLGRIFEPYFTTKEPGHGTGLGLSVVHGIVTRHGGSINVVSEPGKGATFNVYFPRIEAAPPSAQAPTEEPAPSGHERILLVDDEVQIVTMLRQMLEGMGYRVTARTSSIEALEAFRAKPDAFDLVITDLTMPQLIGTELARTILALRPGIPVLLCTGFSGLAVQEKAKEIGIRDYVMKPVVKSDMAKKVRTILDQIRG
jgi:PAS domain S-box-containing protein